MLTCRSGVCLGPHRLNYCLPSCISSTQTHTLTGPSLAQLASLFVEAIKVGKMSGGKSLELFPTVLTALAACDILSYGKGMYKYYPLCQSMKRTLFKIVHNLYLGELSGEEYKKQLINTLCSTR